MTKKAAKIFLQKKFISVMLFSMEVLKVEPKQPIEQQFLLQAQAVGVKLHIGQMNKAEHEGLIREIGRYEINLEENGKIITLLKQEVSCLTAPFSLLTPPPLQPSSTPAEQGRVEAAAGGKPNIQQEFLDKAIRENQSLTLYLITGQRIKGVIEGYDNFTILISEGGRQHLYYKHAITTINR
jgi:RNA chaperone Hfq